MREFVPAPHATREPMRLTISNVTDSHEQIAHRVANEAVGGSRHPVAGRRSLDGSQRPSRGPTAEMPASVTDELRLPGRPLDDGVRYDMERRFGHDFSGVRVHDGASAQRSAYDVDAQAYTVGRDIVLRAGQYAPGTFHGRRLIAHELAHTIDQAAS